jgi:hypothetical protein
MPNRIVGRRDQSGDEWRWLPVPVDEPKRDFGGGRNPRRNLLLAALGAVLIFIGVVLLVVFADNSASEPDSSSSAGPGTDSASVSTTTEAASGTGGPTATEDASSGSPPPPGDVRMYVWSRQDQQWLDSDNLQDNPGYAEGETIPFMLELVGATNGAVYDVTIEYQCRTPAGAAFDYLGSIADEKDDAINMTPPGPVRREDASILVPDDPSIPFDQPGRRLRTWDASFERMPGGPLPAEPCEDIKRVTLSLLAQGQTAVLIWGGHLAAESDWGEGQGAASQPMPIGMGVSVNSPDPQRLGVGPDAIAPQPSMDPGFPLLPP